MSARIKGFDGVRALAAMTVVLTHLGVYRFILEKGWVSSTFLGAINGAAGVQVFFVLSGFLITRLLVEEHDKNGFISKYNFFVRRVLRIFPLYFVVVAFIVVMHLAGTRATNWVAVGYAASYMSNFIPRENYSPILGHTWSLAVEEHFYLIWPFVFSFFAKRRAVLCLFLLASIAFSFAVVYLITTYTDMARLYFINRWSFVAGVNIAFGCLSAMAMTAGKLDSISLRLNMGLLCVGLFAVFGLSQLGKFNSYVIEYTRGAGFAMLVSWLYLNQSGFVVRILDVRPLRYLGMVSYGIYMYQGFFLSTGAYREPGQTWPPSPWLGALMLFVVVPLSYHYFESPVLALKHKFQRRTAQPKFQIADAGASG